MHHRSFAALIGVALLVLITPRATDAGPLWTYKATFGPVGGPGWLVFDTTYVATSGDDLPPSLPTPSWYFDNDGFGTSGVLAGSAYGKSIIGFTVPNGYGISYDPIPAGQPSSDRFRIDFSITDNASGQTAGTSLTGKVTMQYRAGDSSGELVPTYVLWDIGDPTRHTWTLGTNTYQVDLYDRSGEQDDKLYADVLLYPTPVGGPEAPEPGPVTPEPATLLLAGIGLGGIGALRLRRRVKA